MGESIGGVGKVAADICASRDRLERRAYDTISAAYPGDRMTLAASIDLYRSSSTTCGTNGSGHHGGAFLAAGDQPSGHADRNPKRSETSAHATHPSPVHGVELGPYCRDRCRIQSTGKAGNDKKIAQGSLLRGALRILAGVEQTAERALRVRPRLIPGLSKVCVAMLLFCGVAAGQEAARGNAPDGAAIFSQRCSYCHGDRGQGLAAAVTIAGPSLQAEHDLGNVMTAVESGPSHMPAFSRVLTAQQIQAVSHYVTANLAVIPLTQGNIGEGGKLFRTNCAACHRTAVHGGVLAFAGRNAPELTDKSAALIAGAIRWGPGTMPAFPRAVLSDEQLASTVDYIRFVQHPPNPGGIPLKEVGPVAEGGLAALAALFVIGIAGWIERGGKG